MPSAHSGRLAAEAPVLEQSRARLLELARRAGLLDTEVSVFAGPLTAEQAIGTPVRRDFPILVGKERVVEARLAGARGHSFTDSPSEYFGTLRKVLGLELDTNARRAIFVAVLNAALRHLGLAGGTVHCRDEDPERCARTIAADLVRVVGAAPKDHSLAVRASVGLVGLNPAIAEQLVAAFGAERVLVTDLNPAQIGVKRFGVEIWDGRERWAELVARSQLVLVTGTTLVNATFDPLWRAVQASRKRGIVYGVTTAGVAALLGLERLCPYGRDG